MAISLTRLRVDLYKVIDKVIETGIPVEIKRKGHLLLIVPEEPQKKLGRLIKHPGTIQGNPEDLVHSDWSNHWNEEKNL